MKLIFFSLLLSLAIGCATKTNSPVITPDDMRISKALDSVDFRLWGEFSEGKIDGYKSITSDSYDSFLKTQNDSLANDLKKSLNDFELQTIEGYDKSFVFCGFSSKLGIAFCDDASCTKVEHFEKAQSADVINTWKQELPLKECIPSQKTTAVGASFTNQSVDEVNLLKKNDQIILDHKYFIVHYNKAFRLANYVEYTLTAEQLKKSVPGSRKDSFKADPLLADHKDEQVFPKEYAKTGYHRGHLATSADFTFDKEANKATFVMSNMVPQKPNLNSDAWLKLENQVRLWACGESEIRVVSGPMLRSELKKFKSGLPIPEKFFKIVLDETPPKKILAFVYYQKDKGDVMADRQITWDKLKNQIKGQIEDKEVELIASYPKSELSDWKSEDCIPKPKKKKLIVKK